MYGDGKYMTLNENVMITMTMIGKAIEKGAVEDIKSYLQKEITTSKQVLQRKTEMIEQLQKEVAEEKSKLEGMNQILQQGDLEKMAEEINTKINR